MMTEYSQMQDHDEIDLLLPWFVNETLHPAEHERVAAHLKTCSICRDSVALLTDVQSAVVRHKATPIVPQPRVNELMDSISPKVSTGKSDLGYARVFLAAAGITALLVATLLLTNSQNAINVPQIFETATSSAGNSAMDYVLSIQFESGTTVAEREQILQDIEARDVSGGGDIGAFRVIVQLPAASLDELDRYTENLEAMSAVKTVSVVALQLPMRPQQ